MSAPEISSANPVHVGLVRFEDLPQISYSSTDKSGIMEWSAHLTRTITCPQARLDAEVQSLGCKSEPVRVNGVSYGGGWTLESVSDPVDVGGLRRFSASYVRNGVTPFEIHLPSWVFVRYEGGDAVVCAWKHNGREYVEIVRFTAAARCYGFEVRYPRHVIEREADGYVVGEITYYDCDLYYEGTRIAHIDGLRREWDDDTTGTYQKTKRYGVSAVTMVPTSAGANRWTSNSGGISFPVYSASTKTYYRPCLTSPSMCYEDEDDARAAASSRESAVRTALEEEIAATQAVVDAGGSTSGLLVGIDSIVTTVEEVWTGRKAIRQGSALLPVYAEHPERGAIQSYTYDFRPGFNPEKSHLSDDLETRWRYEIVVKLRYGGDPTQMSESVSIGGAVRLAWRVPDPANVNVVELAYGDNVLFRIDRDKISEETP